MTIERNLLPGQPSMSLIRKVRQVLRLYVQCRPEKSNRTWRMTWEWADAVAFENGKWLKARKRWPSASEIASQFLLLALADMRSHWQLRLPYHAAKAIPSSVQERLGCGVPGLSATQSRPLEPGEVVGNVPARLTGDVTLGIPFDTEPHPTALRGRNCDGTA